MGESPSRDESDRQFSGSPSESDTEGEDPGLGGLYREPEPSPGPSPVSPMETPYLQLEARPGAEQGPRPGAWPGANRAPQPGASRAPQPGASRAPQPEQTWLPPPQPAPCPDTYMPGPVWHTYRLPYPEPQWSPPPRPGPTGTNRDPDNREQEEPQPEPPWLQPPRPGPYPDTYVPEYPAYPYGWHAYRSAHPDTYVPGHYPGYPYGWNTYRLPYPDPYGPRAYLPDQSPFGPQCHFRPDSYASGLYVPVPRYHFESTRACYSTPQWQVQENQVNSSIPIPGTSVPAVVPIVSNPTSVSLSAPSAMSTPSASIMRDFVKDLSAVDLADIQEGLALLRRQRLSNASLSASVVTPSVATPIASGVLGVVSMTRSPPAAAEGGSRAMMPRKNLNDKLLPYDGQSEPFESFRTRYEGCSYHYQWDPAERLYFLRQALDRKVNNVVWDSGNVATAEQLLELLAARYGTEAQAAGFRSELKWRTKKRTESQHDLYYDVRRLASLAWPGQQGTQV